MSVPTGFGNYPPGVTDMDPHFDSEDEGGDDSEERQRYDDEQALLKEDAENFNAWLDELEKQLGERNDWDG